VPFLLHDETLARTGGRPERLADLEAEEARSVDAGRWFGEAFAEEPLPELAPALEALGDLRAIVELKDDRFPEGAAARTTEALRDRASRKLATAVSFHPGILSELRGRLPFLRTGLLVDDPGEDPVDRLEACGASVLLARHGSVDDDLVSYCARAGYPVFAWTVDDLDEMERVLDCGALGVVSNRPELFADLAGRGY
jgi:glycerophosphoryl diester phosphodiesterase